MQFLFTLHQCEEPIRSFWWRMTKPISSFVSFDNFQYLFKLIDIRDRTPNWQDYQFHVSVMGMSLCDTFKNHFQSDRRGHAIINARGCIPKRIGISTFPGTSISTYQFQDIILLFGKKTTYVFIIDRYKPFDGSPNV